jgi:hypothetical protein
MVSWVRVDAIAGDEPAQKKSASETIAQMQDSCLSACSRAGRSDAPCTRYCACHIEALREGLSDEQVADMLRLASDGKSKKGEMIRRWLQESAGVCRREVFGDEVEKPAQ